jgi:purine catabolism regulator
VLHAEVADRLAVVYPAAGRLRGRVLAAVAGTAGVVAGESTEAGSVELARALREAEQALAAGIRSGAPLTCFADIGASGLLSLLAGPSAGAFAESLLRPLIEHDRSGRGDLVRSLATWLEHNGEWDAAATAVGVHRHTLRHRVRRAAELLGRDLDAAAVRAELWIALRLLDGTAPAPQATPVRPTGPTGCPEGPERRLAR